MNQTEQSTAIDKIKALKVSDCDLKHYDLRTSIAVNNAIDKVLAILEADKPVQDISKEEAQEMQDTAVKMITDELKLGICVECKKRNAVKDYNGHGCYVCDPCFVSMSNYFDEEYR